MDQTDPRHTYRQSAARTIGKIRGAHKMFDAHIIIMIE